MPVNWVQVTKTGRVPLLLISIFPYAYKEGLLKKFLKANFTIHYYRRVLGATYFNKEEWDDYLKLIKSKENKSPGYLLKLGKEFEKRNKEIVQFCERYKDVDFSRWELQGIEKIYRKLIDLKKKWLVPDYTYYIIDRYLPDVLIAEINKKLKNEKRFNEIIGILTGLDRPTLIRQERLQLLKLAKLVKEKKLSFKNKRIQRFIKDHIKKYGFLNYYFYYYQPYTEKEIEKRIKRILPKELKEEIRKIKIQEKNKELTQKIIQELNLSKKAQLIIKTLKQWGHCLNYLDEAGCLISHYLKGLHSELAKRMKISHKMLAEMAFEEIDEFFKKGVISSRTKVKLKQRVKKYGILWQGTEIKIYSGKELEKWEEAEKRKTESQIKQVDQLKGVAASSGIVKARVRVLESYCDVAKMKRGEILVSPKTNPKFVPAMEKASAIITDEGGLLSHAAIISRELKIPCVVGTKIATRALKDGDLVKVDANKGVVRIIKNKN